MLWLRKGFGFAGAWTVCEHKKAALSAIRDRRAHGPASEVWLHDYHGRSPRHLLSSPMLG
jgi:hypothetical protein